MKFLKNVFAGLFPSIPRTTPEERYLNESVDIVDLERRIHLIDRNMAPFQTMFR